MPCVVPTSTCQSCPDSPGLMFLCEGLVVAFPCSMHQLLILPPGMGAVSNRSSGNARISKPYYINLEVELG
jgi:hypothetical protein